MQTYKVFLSDFAKFDLQGIVSYITKAESSTRAKHVERGILSEIKRLKHFPIAYSKDENTSIGRKTIRFSVKWHYKILFSVEADTVQVVSIFHTAQNPDKLRDLT
jgi:plasmid stabilization system protein ParE